MKGTPHYKKTTPIRDMMMRVDLIDFQRPPKPTYKGKEIAYHSEIFRWLEELIIIARGLHAQKQPPVRELELQEELKLLKHAAMVMRRNHVKLKAKLVLLRRQLK